MVTVTKRARAGRGLATVTRVVGNEEGNGDGGKSNGDCDEEGKGKGGKRDGDGNKEGKGEGGKRDGNSN
jgi:hypothetical protein